MFDWVAKKTQPVGSKFIKSSGDDFDDLFSLDNKKVEVDKKVPEPIKKTPTVSAKMPMVEAKTVEVQRLNPPPQPKPKVEEKIDSIVISEPTMVEEKKQVQTSDIETIYLEEGTVSPTGAASSTQDNINKGSQQASEDWYFPDVLSFLNDIDSQAIFQSPIKDSKQITSEVKKEESEPHVFIKPDKKDTDDDEDEVNDELIKKLIKGRFPYHSGKENFDKQLRESASPYSNAFEETRNHPPAMIVDDFGDRTLWELQLNNSNLPGMELNELNLIPYDHIYINEMRRGFKRARRDFIKFVCYNNQQDLFAAGMEDTDVSLLRKGIVPENFNIHRKVPYEYGGNNDFSNLCLIQTHPYHDNLHKFLDMQIFIHPKGTKVKRLFMPTPTGNVYIPYLDINGSGGKSKHDRSVYAGFDKGTLDLISLKSSMGKAAEL